MGWPGASIPDHNKASPTTVMTTGHTRGTGRRSASGRSEGTGQSSLIGPTDPYSLGCIRHLPPADARTVGRRHHEDMNEIRTLLRSRSWNRLSPLQLVAAAVATVPPLLILGAVLAGVTGLITEQAMIDLALAAGENPGTFIFGMMFLASPIQWLTGRSQVRVRKYLGIVFYLLAVSNLAMFILEAGIGATFSAPFLVAGMVAVLLATPLFLTSSRWSQRWMGMRRWRLLHRLTYVIAVALVAHVALIGEVGFGSTLIALGFVARIPAVRRWLTQRSVERRPEGSVQLPASSVPWPAMGAAPNSGSSHSGAASPDSPFMRSPRST